MKHFISTLPLIAVIFIAGVSIAAQKTVTLAVENMNCASCSFIVKQNLSNVKGVTKVNVSFKQKTATIIFDDAKTNVKALTNVTSSAGSTSRPVS